MVVVAAVLFQVAHAHISLTFPPARLPNYDFLDNVRTGGPCGVPGESLMQPWNELELVECNCCLHEKNAFFDVSQFVRVLVFYLTSIFFPLFSRLFAEDTTNGLVTTFRAGTTINVTFHLAYPHRVRCQLQLFM